jgi:hypothetical protein
VALSRCRGLSGLTLSSKISAESLFNDNNIVQFSSNKQNRDEVTQIFNASKTGYVQTVLFNLFDFTDIQHLREELAGLLHLHNKRVQQDAMNWSIGFFGKLDQQISVGFKFKNQLNNFLNGASNLESDAQLQTRIREASHYFNKTTDDLILELRSLPAFTESKEAADDINTSLQQLFEELYTKNNLYLSTLNGFELTTFLKAKLKIVFPNFKMNVYATAKNTKQTSDTSHPVLYKQLLLLRDEICNEEHKPIYLVANSKTLKELVEFLPTNSDHLLKISGFGEAKVHVYGDRFLSIIKEYMLEFDLSSNMDALGTKKTQKAKKEKEPKSPGEKKVSSKEQTYNLFKEGFSLPEIAQLRGFAQSTLEEHLTSYVASGEIDINKLVPLNKQKIILKALENFNKEGGLNAIKNILPEDVSYGEIKYVLAFKDRE